jgi:hypothetical protein
MTDTERKSPVTAKDSGATDAIRVNTIHIPRPSDDQVSYLTDILSSTGRFDSEVVIGGPNTVKVEIHRPSRRP